MITNMSSSGFQGLFLLICLIIGSILIQGISSTDPSSSDVFPEPMQNVTVHSGQNATFSCVVAYPNCTAFAWNHQKEIVFLNGRLMNMVDKYHTTFSAKSGRQILDILDAAVDDEGPVKCSAICGSDGDKWQTTAAYLNVLVPPSDVVITQSGNPVLNVAQRMDETVNLTCIARGGRPTPALIWHNESAKIQESSNEFQLDTWKSGDAIYSSIVFRAMPRDHEKSFTCDAITPALAAPVARTVKLSVSYPPVMPVITRPGNPGLGFHLGGSRSEVILKCSTDGGNPPPVLTWFFKGQEVPGTRGIQSSTNGATDSTLVFSPKPSDNHARITCEATNALMEQGISAEYFLLLWFGPSNLSLKGDAVAMQNEAVQAECIAEASYPAASISWIINSQAYTANSEINDPVDSDRTAYNASARIIVNVTSSDRGNIRATCVAKNPKTGETLHRTIVIPIIAPPGSLDDPSAASASHITVSDGNGNVMAPSPDTSASQNDSQVLGRKPENLTMIIAIAASIGGVVFFGLLGCLIYVIIRGKVKKFEEMANSDSSGSSKGHTEVCSQTGMDTGTDTTGSDVEKTPIESYNQSKSAISPSVIRTNAARTYLLDENYHSPYGSYKHWTAPEPGNHDMYNDAGIDFDGEGDYTEALRRTAMQSLMPHTHSPSPLRAIPHHLTYEPIHKTSMLSTFHGQSMPTYRAEALVDELKGHLV